MSFQKQYTNIPDDSTTDSGASDVSEPSLTGDCYPESFEPQEFERQLYKTRKHARKFTEDTLERSLLMEKYREVSNSNDIGTNSESGGASTRGRMFCNLNRSPPRAPQVTINTSLNNVADQIPRSMNNSITKSRDIHNNGELPTSPITSNNLQPSTPVTYYSDNSRKSELNPEFSTSNRQRNLITSPPLNISGSPTSPKSTRNLPCIPSDTMNSSIANPVCQPRAPDLSTSPDGGLQYYRDFVKDAPVRTNFQARVDSSQSFSEAQIENNHEQYNRSQKCSTFKSPPNIQQSSMMPNTSYGANSRINNSLNASNIMNSCPCPVPSINVRRPSQDCVPVSPQQDTINSTFNQGFYMDGPGSPSNYNESLYYRNAGLTSPEKSDVCPPFPVDPRLNYSLLSQNTNVIRRDLESKSEMKLQNNPMNKSVINPGLQAPPCMTSCAQNQSNRTSPPTQFTLPGQIQQEQPTSSVKPSEYGMPEFYHPGVLEESIRRNIDYTTAAEMDRLFGQNVTNNDQQPVKLSLLQAFDKKVTNMLEIYKKDDDVDPNTSQTPKKKQPPNQIVEDFDVPDMMNQDLIFEDSVRLSTTPIDLGRLKPKQTPKTNLEKAVECLARAQEMNDYYKKLRAAEYASKHAPLAMIEEAARAAAKSIHSNDQNQSLASRSVMNMDDIQFYSPDTYQPIEIMSYIGITNPEK